MSRKPSRWPALQVKCKTHKSPIKPGWEGLPRLVVKLHIISYRSIKPYTRGILGVMVFNLVNTGKRYEFDN
jgi:hypothetical protein